MSNISCVLYELHFVRNNTIQVTFFLPSVSKALANDRAHLVECNLVESNLFGQKGKCISTSCIDLIHNPEDLTKLPNTHERFDSISPDAHDTSSPDAHIPYSICSLNRPIWLLCTFEFNINNTLNNVTNTGNTISIKFNFECDWMSYYDLHKLYYPIKPVYHKKYTSNGRINLAINCIKNITKSVFMSQYRAVLNVNVSDDSSEEVSACADDELNENYRDINSCKDINNNYDELGEINDLYYIECELNKESKNKFLSKKITKKFKKSKSSNNNKKSGKNVQDVKRYQKNRFCKKNKNNNFVIMKKNIYMSDVMDSIEINQLLKQGKKYL